MGTGIHQVQAVYATAFGTKYIIDGRIAGPSGARAGVRTVWITETDLAPRLVTAYPTGAIEREGDDEGA